MSQQLVSSNKPRELSPSSYAPVGAQESAVSRSEKKNKMVSTGPSSPSASNADAKKFEKKKLNLGKANDQREQTVNISEDDLPNMIEEEVEDQDTDLLREPAKLKASAPVENADLEAIANRTAASMKNQTGVAVSKANSLTPQEATSSNVSESTDVTRSPFVEGTEPVEPEDDEAILDARRPAQQAALSGKQANAPKQDVTKKAKEKTERAVATLPETKRVEIKPTEAAMKPAKVIESPKNAASSSPAVSTSKEPEEAPSFLTKRDPSQSTATMEAALEAFVDEAKTWTNTFPNPVIDDKKLANLAKSPLSMTQVTATLPANARSRSGASMLIVGLLVGSVIAFGAVWFLGVGQNKPTPITTEMAQEPVTTPAQAEPQQAVQPETEASQTAAAGQPAETLSVEPEQAKATEPVEPDTAERGTASAATETETKTATSAEIPSSKTASGKTATETKEAANVTAESKAEPKTEPKEPLTETAAKTASTDKPAEAKPATDALDQLLKAEPKPTKRAIKASTSPKKAKAAPSAKSSDAPKKEIPKKKASEKGGDNEWVDPFAQ